MRILQTGSPDKLIVIGGSFEPYANEDTLHSLFSEFRLHGEWYSPADKIFNYINEKCFRSMPALYQAYYEIKRGNFTYEDAIHMGDALLNQHAEKRSLEIQNTMFLKDGKSIFE